MSAAQQGTSTSTGSTTTFATKNPFAAAAQANLGTTATGINVAGSTNSGTFAQVVAPGKMLLHALRALFDDQIQILLQLLLLIMLAGL